MQDWASRRSAKNELSPQALLLSLGESPLRTVADLGGELEP